MLSALVVAASMLTPQARLICASMLLLGIPYSIYLSQRSKDRIFLNIVALVPLIGVTWFIVRNLPGFQLDWSNPVESFFAHESGDILIAFLHVLAVTACARAFLLITPRDLLQTPVPSIAIFLLASITPLSDRAIDKDPLTLLCLLVLFFTSLYLFGLVNHFQWFTRRLPRMAHWHLIQFISILLLIAFPLTLLAGNSLRAFNMNNVSQSLAQRQMNWQQLPRFMQGNYAVSLENRIEVGGARWPSGNQVIMTVDTDKAGSHLWRSTSYDFYQRGRWSSTLEQYERVPGDIENGQGPIRTFSIDSRDEMFAYTVDNNAVRFSRLTSGMTDTVGVLQQHFSLKVRGIGAQFPIYGAYQIARFSTAELTSPLVIARHDNSLLTPTHALRNERLSNYNVVSVIKPLPGSYRAPSNIPLANNLQDAYLQMPVDHDIQHQIKEKALEILREAKLTPQDDVSRIVRTFELYLGRQYKYTLNPSPPKDHADPIVDFLYFQKQGYCNYFSGALVMLCRSIGIPARFVVGFASGEMETVSQDGGTNLYRYTVTAEQAHSWVEVYLPNYGWYESDPTAGSSEATTFIGRSWNIFTDTFAMLKQSVQNGIAYWRQHPRARVSSWVGLAVLLLSAGMLLLLRRERPPVYPISELTATEARRTIIAAYHRMNRWLERWGIAKKLPADTAAEFVRLFPPQHSVMAEQIHALTALYIQASYGNEPITDAEARTAIEILQHLWKHDKTERRQLRALAPDIAQE